MRENNNKTINKFKKKNIEKSNIIKHSLKNKKIMKLCFKIKPKLKKKVIKSKNHKNLLINQVFFIYYLKITQK